jgi:hypothetical protein
MLNYSYCYILRIGHTISHYIAYVTKQHSDETCAYYCELIV